MYELNRDLLVCKLFKVPKFEDRLDIFLMKFLDPKLFFMKEFCEIYDGRIQYALFLRFILPTGISVSKLARGSGRGFWGLSSRLLWSFRESYEEDPFPSF